MVRFRLLCGRLLLLLFFFFFFFFFFFGGGGGGGAARSVDHMFFLYFGCLLFWLFLVLVMGAGLGSVFSSSWSLHTRYF